MGVDYVFKIWTRKARVIFGEQEVTNVISKCTFLRIMMHAKWILKTCCSRGTLNVRVSSEFESKNAV